MREILFRGKGTHGHKTGKWVYGNYTKDFWGINHKGFGILPIEGGYNEVDPETVGQYTGLTDKNGTKIFEGDIVKCIDTIGNYEFIAVVMFGNPNGEYNWGFQLKRISGAGANTDILLWVEMEETGAFIEVIGNIHDNPQLLGGE